MKKSRILKTSFKTMERNKLRTFFMMIGIIVGILALTLILSLGSGSEKKMMDNVKRMFSSDNVLIGAGGGMMMGPRGGSTTTLTLLDIETLQREIQNIVMWDPMQMDFGKEVRYKDKSTELVILGHSPNAETLWNRSVISGSFFTEADMKQSARVALIGQTAAAELFGDSDPMGEQIRIGTIPFRIIGVLEQMGIDPHGMDKDNEIYVPITTIMRRLMNVDYIMSAKIQLNDMGKIDETVEQITELLRERHHLTGSEPNDFYLLTPVQVQEMVSGMNSVFKVFLPLIAGLSLLVGGIVISVLMLMSVNERIAEIGLRKAVGARARDILGQFLVESAVVTVVGGLIGLLLGFVSMLAMTAIMDLPAVFSWPALGIGLAASVGIGLCAGIIPARRAADLDPVEALR